MIAPNKKPPGTIKADFVRAHPEMSVADLLVAAKAAGVQLSKSLAFEIRAGIRRSAASAGDAVSDAPTPTASAPAVAAASPSKSAAKKKKSRRKRRAKPAVAQVAVTSTPVVAKSAATPAEAVLRQFVLERGLVHVEAVVADIKATLTAWATSA